MIQGRLGYQKQINFYFRPKYYNIKSIEFCYYCANYIFKVILKGCNIGQYPMLIFKVLRSLMMVIPLIRGGIFMLSVLENCIIVKGISFSLKRSHLHLVIPLLIKP